ncbi:hypothetical protein BTR23_17790 [Alkalihalophilus pseudofirmus]|nr:hypothetical protein BTR23_17790 [Alkalihalophilus pseudofirmus]
MIDDNIKKYINLWILKINQYQKLNILQKVNIAKKVLKLRYKMIGFGYHRIVYDLENGFVLKVAISIAGIYNNKTENQIYHFSQEDSFLKNSVEF